jgi:hypothetical protein
MSGSLARREPQRGKQVTSQTAVVCLSVDERAATPLNANALQLSGAWLSPCSCRNWAGKFSDAAPSRTQPHQHPGFSHLSKRPKQTTIHCPSSQPLFQDVSVRKEIPWACRLVNCTIRLYSISSQKLTCKFIAKPMTPFFIAGMFIKFKRTPNLHTSLRCR